MGIASAFALGARTDAVAPPVPAWHASAIGALETFAPSHQALWRAATSADQRLRFAAADIKRI
jgi:hypothetical protein